MTFASPPAPGWGRVLGESGIRKLALSEAPRAVAATTAEQKCHFMFLGRAGSCADGGTRAGLQARRCSPQPCATSPSTPSPGGRHRRAPRPAAEKAPGLLADASCEPPHIQLLPPFLLDLGDHQVLPSSPTPAAQGSLQSLGRTCPTTSCLHMHRAFLHRKIT